MSTKITINGNTYNMPTAGTNAGWGEDATSVILDLVSLVNSLAGTNYISESSDNLDAENTPADVLGLLFNKDITRAVSVKYVIKINATVPLTEEGTLEIHYSPNDSTWKMTREYSGNETGVILTITSNGQVQYNRPAFSGLTSSIIYFKTSSLLSVTA